MLNKQEILLHGHTHYQHIETDNTTKKNIQNFIITFVIIVMCKFVGNNINSES